MQKATEIEIAAGDRVTFLTAGGGGYGDPRRRSADALRNDIKAGLVTEKGLVDYGVTAEELRMSASIAAARRRALTSRMADSQLDFLLVYGNAWQSDYLRYATDFGILEGEALALISRDGEVTLFVDSALEAERARGETAAVQTVYSSVHAE